MPYRASIARARSRHRNHRARRAVAAALATLTAWLVVAAPLPAAEPAAALDSLVTTIIVVRHAERNLKMVGNDQPLSEAGAQRAKELARVLDKTGVQAIYVTEWQRNRQTAEPIAAKLKDSLRVLHGKDFVAQAEMIRERHRGQTVLVVGHSNTVPQLIEAWTGQKTYFDEGEFDALFVVNLAPGLKPRVTRLKYGAPNPAP